MLKFVDNTDVLLDAIAKDAFIYKLISSKFKKSRDFNLKSAQANGQILKYLHKDYRADKEIALAAINTIHYI
jgi:hypothetical protein